MLGRHDHRADPGHGEPLSAHPGLQRIEDQRRDDLSLELHHPYVPQREARMIGVELPACLGARHPVRPRSELGERLDVGPPCGAVANGGWARGARAQSRASWSWTKMTVPERERMIPGPRSLPPLPSAVM